MEKRTYDKKGRFYKNGDYVVKIKEKDPKIFNYLEEKVIYKEKGKHVSYQEETITESKPIEDEIKDEIEDIEKLEVSLEKAEEEDIQDTKEYQKQEQELVSIATIIKENLDEQEKLIKELNYKLEKAVTITQKKTETIKIMGSLIQILLLQAIIMNANKKKHNRAAKAMLAASALLLLKKLLEPTIETKNITIVEVEDFEKEIISALYDIDQIKDTIDGGMLQIEDIIEEIKERFKDQEETLEYKKLLENLDQLFDDLKKSKDEILEMEKEQEKNLDKNDDQLKLIKK